MSDRFEELLDKVLREENAVEPRAGLERRVMARVGERSAAASRRWMFTAWAGGLGVAAVVLVVLLPGRPKARVVGHDGLAVSNPAAASLGHGLPSGAKALPAPTIYGTAEAVPLSKAGSRPGAARRVSAEMGATSRWAEASRKHAVEDEAALPKLDVFPSPVVTEEDRATAAALRLTEAAEAMASLQKEQREPIRIAAIEIAPLQVADLERAQ